MILLLCRHWHVRDRLFGVIDEEVLDLRYDAERGRLRITRCRTTDVPYRDRFEGFTR